MASPVTVPNNFVAGTSSVADDVDANFDAITGWVNTNAVHLDGTKSFTAPVGGITPVSSSQLATKGYIDSLLARAEYRGYVTTTQSVPASSTPVINFATVPNNTFGAAMTTNNQNFTIPTSGVYTFTFRPVFTAPVASIIHRIAFSGQGNFENAVNDQVSVLAFTLYLPAGETFTVQVANSSGMAHTLNSSTSLYVGKNVAV